VHKQTQHRSLGPENDLRARATSDHHAIAYGANPSETQRQAGNYVGREKPADLPVQQPTKFELAVNLKTAKALGIDVPIGLSTAADELIQ
jgi:putative ABC transport system substrate-binding protein